MAGKGFDAKAFLVNHTEKLVLGAAGLMVLAFAAGAQWKPYSGTPQEILDKVAKGEKELVNHGWPQEDRDRYQLTQASMPKQKVHDLLLQPMLISQYEMSTRFTTTPWQGKEPLRDPTRLALEGAIATAGKVLIERPVDPEAAAAEEEKDPKKKDGDKKPAEPEVSPEDDEFATKRPAAGAGYPGGLPGAASGGLPGASDSAAFSGGVDSGSSGGLPGSSESMMALYGGYPGEGGPSGMTAVNRDARGYYFASVRAVFPLKEQIRRYQDATNAKSFDIASMNFEVIDFNLERQEQVDKAGTWSDWQAVDIQTAVDVLSESMPPEPDLVSGAVTNSVITMPLPPLIYGNWKKHASHPKINEFVLDEEQMKLEIEYQTKILEQLRDSKKNTETKPRREKGGFSSVIGDSRTLQSELLGGSAYGGAGGYGYGGSGSGSGSSYPGMGSGSPGGGGFLGMPGASAGPPGYPGAPGAGRPGAKGKQEDPLKKLLDAAEKGEQGKALREFIEKRVRADGELLLFRYFDFSVEPGKTYRYRVRLVLNNPNYGRLPSEANGEAQVVEGETRTTEWSEPTPPVSIERDVYYFVKDVDTKRNKTRVSVYQWDTKLGTTVNADLDLYPGQHVAGVAKTSVIDPAKNKMEDKNYDFKSSDVFVDTRSDVSLDRAFHEGLEIPQGNTQELLLPEQLLVVDSNTGELSVIDPVLMAAEQARLEDQQKRQKAGFEKLMAAPQENAGYDMMYGAAYGEDSGTSGGKSSKKGKSRNPLAGGYGGSGGSGMGYPGMGGSGYPGMGGSGGSGRGKGAGRRGGGGSSAAP